MHSHVIEKDRRPILTHRGLISIVYGLETHTDYAHDYGHSYVYVFKSNIDIIHTKNTEYEYKR